MRLGEVSSMDAIKKVETWLIGLGLESKLAFENFL